MENIILRLDSSTPNLDFEEFSPLFIDSDCKRFNWIYSSIHDSIKVIRTRSEQYSSASSSAANICTSPAVTKKTGVFTLANFQREEAPVCEVVYAYSPTSGGSRTFRSGIAGPSPPHPMPHRASYRIMTREVLLKGLKDSEGFCWFIRASNEDNMDTIAFHSEASKFLFDTGSSKCHTYCEGTFVKRDSSRLVQKHYPGIKVFNNANILLDPGATPHCIKYADGSEYNISLATVKLCLDLVLTGGDSRNEILYMENFRMGISQFVPERTARQDNDASIHGILGFGVPALGLMHGVPLHEPIYVQVHQGVRRGGFANSSQFLVDLTRDRNTSYERVVLSPSLRHLNSVATWSPGVECVPRGEWWGINPQRLYLRLHGREIDLTPQISKSTRQGLPFVFDTGAVNHCLTKALAEIIQQIIPDAQLVNLKERRGFNYDILTMPASCMADPPTLIIQLQTNPTNENNRLLKRLEIPLCQTSTNNIDLKSGGDAITFCLSGYPQAAVGVKNVSVLGSMFFRKYLVLFAPNSGSGYTSLTNNMRFGLPNPQ